ncbi:MAG: hypothetical protein H7233_07265 [Pseudorhodobacter sp.]|nr:hypothetical protein [Frankiaceae bacterium]
MVDQALDVAALLLPPVMPVVAAFLALLCWRIGAWRAAALCLLGPAAACLTTAALKPLLARPSGTGEGWMFPSGHVTVVAAVAAAGAVVLLPDGVLASRLSLAWRRVARVSVLLVPAATSLGTAGHRYHHPTDVVGALLVATVAVLLVAAALDRGPRASPMTRDGPAATIGDAHRSHEPRRPSAGPAAADVGAGNAQTPTRRPSCHDQTRC